MRTENCQILSNGGKNSLTKYFVKVYGCQYNEWDATRVKHLLANFGLSESSEQEADIVFVLACAVRQTSVDRMTGKIRNWSKAGKKVVLCGCVLDADRKKFEKNGIQFWDSNDIKSLGTVLGQQYNNSTIQQSAAPPLLPIMTGCNNFCTYCAVPYVRGREKSRPMKKIIAEFKSLVAVGQKEIILLGQNVNSYKYGFAKLLNQLDNIPGDFIISFTSNHPKDMSDDIIKAVATLSKVKKAIHLPLQSGSDKILKAMNRPYTRKQYIKLVKKIRKNIPNVVISTDVIVGFPSETEKEFEDTVAIFRELNFDAAYINKYSPRKGTAAFELGDPIPWEEKERRWRILNDISYYKK